MATPFMHAPDVTPSQVDSDPHPHSTGDPPAAPGKKPEKGHPLRKFIVIGTILVLIVLAWLRIAHTHQEASAKAAGPDRAQLTVPVVAGIAEQEDVPIYADGLGIVQSLAAVTVRPRVDGQIVKIAFEEGQDVQAGDLLVQIDPAPFQATLGQAQAKQRQDEVQLANARADLTRDTELAAKKVIAQQQFDKQKALTGQLEAAVANDKAAVDSAQVQLDYTQVKSPISGRVGIRNVDEGNIVHATDTTGIVVITQLKPIAILFTLPEQTLGAIHEGQTEQRSMKVLAIARDNKTLLDEGTLTVVDNQIDPSTGTIRLKAVFPNDRLQLWPGQFVNVRLLVSTKKDGVVVPASVIQRGPDGPFAYVIGEDLTVSMRTVKVAQMDEDTALIDAGLKAGEKVVVDGQYRLRPGAHVQISDAPGSKGDASPKAHASPAPHGKPAGVAPEEPAESAGGRSARTQPKANP